MSLFQTTVLKSYLNTQDKEIIAKQYKKYSKFFNNSTTQENIRKSKEEQFQAKFLDELFVSVLGYTLFPKPNYNLTTEFKNLSNAQKADGAILQDNKAVAVIELKGTNTRDLNKIEKQAFGYKNNQPDCVYVITSNFEKLRFYIDNAVEHIEFNLFELTSEEFELLWLCLSKESILSNLPQKIKSESITEEKEITNNLYKDYSTFKRLLYRDLVKSNMRNEVFRSELLSEDGEAATKNIKRTLFKKSQKLIDRFLFIFFAEDRDLIPANTTLSILKEWETLQKMRASGSLYDRFKLYFSDLDKGRKDEHGREEIYAYNGGLFRPDNVLDSLIINDALLAEQTRILCEYDFDSQISVNVLGHIFENSLNEIESVNAEIDGVNFDKQKSKRKKDGVFYTPQYITRYIVESTVGKLCTEKKEELNIDPDEYYKGKKGRQKKTVELLNQKLEEYREWLLSLTILDPACGSGAFLNEAMEFLIKEHGWIDELHSVFYGDAMVISNVENTILERNIFGVDINEESVEIAKLSLWLRSAAPRRKLNDLSSNIKCGNSLISVKAVAGDKAFDWEKEFPEIFAKGGFDVVIGNPPYGDYFNEKEKEFILKHYSRSFSGTFDMYIVFFEIALTLIKSAGHLCFITPNTFLDYAQFSGLRNLLMKGNCIQQVIALTGVFEDAIVDSVIINLVKEMEQSASFKGVRYRKKVDEIDSTTLQDFDLNNLTSDAFTINGSGEFDIRSFLDNGKWDKLCSVIKLTQGITTGGNNCFINDKEYFLNAGVPETSIKKVVMGKDINRYQEYVSGDSILYSTTKLDNETQNKISYLLEPHREKLSKKRETKTGKLPWYSLHWARSESDFLVPKIVIRQTASHIIGHLDEKCLYPIDTLHTLNLYDYSIENPSKYLRFILAILNSSLMNYLYKWKMDEDGKVYPQVKKVNIDWLPIIEYSIDETLSSQTLEIEKACKDYNSAINQFIAYFLFKHPTDKLSKKLQNWHTLSFDEFIKELKKIIKKETGQKLSKKEEFELHSEWQELFEEQKEKVQELKSEIQKIDDEIDEIVFDLYGLNEEERAIVRGES